MKPVVFLDIDGVLCIKGCAPGTFDRSCVHALNWLTDTTRASIVVSSTWRRMKNPTIDDKLREQGVCAKVIGVTPDLSRAKVIRPMSQYAEAAGGVIFTGATRGQEIKAWLDAHAQRPFVILDDDTDMGELGDWLVPSTFEKGLTPALARLAAAKIVTRRLFEP